VVATLGGSGWGVTADLVIFGRGDGWLYGFRRRLAQSQQGCHGGDVQLRKDTVETADRRKRWKTGGKRPASACLRCAGRAKGLEDRGNCGIHERRSVRFLLVLLNGHHKLVAVGHNTGPELRLTLLASRLQNRQLGVSGHDFDGRVALHGAPRPKTWGARSPIALRESTMRRAGVRLRGGDQSTRRADGPP
jgi:hypothetical protein